jgi:hypothetical protein
MYYLSEDYTKLIYRKSKQLQIEKHLFTPFVDTLNLVV